MTLTEKILAWTTGQTRAQTGESSLTSLHAYS
jgi:hypothetical protein